MCWRGGKKWRAGSGGRCYRAGDTLVPVCDTNRYQRLLALAPPLQRPFGTGSYQRSGSNRYYRYADYMFNPTEPFLSIFIPTHFQTNSLLSHSNKSSFFSTILLRLAATIYTRVSNMIFSSGVPNLAHFLWSSSFHFFSANKVFDEMSKLLISFVLYAI